MNADGLNPIQLTDFGGPPVTMPRWAPDGRQIAFNARVDGNADIYLIDANGGAPVRLTEHEASDVAPELVAGLDDGLLLVEPQRDVGGVARCRRAVARPRA